MGDRITNPLTSQLIVLSAGAIGALVAMFRYQVGMIPTLASSAVIGFLYHLIFRA